MQTYRVQIHCIVFEIATHSAKLAKWLEAYFPWSIPALPEWQNKDSYRIVLEEKYTAEQEDIHPCQNGIEIDTPLGHAYCQYEQHRFYSANPAPYEYEVEYCTNTHTLRANLAGVICEDEQAFLTILMSFFLRNFTLAFHKVLFVHSAVLAKNGHGLMLLGDSGAGKSTTALYLMQNGYSLLSDDSPLFTYQEGRAYALCSLDDPRVTPNTLKLLPELNQYINDVPHHFGKFVVNRQKLESGKWKTGPQFINSILVLKRSPEATLSITPFDKHDTLHMLMQHAMVVFKQASIYQENPVVASATNFAFDLLTQLVADANTLALSFNDNDLTQLPAFIESQVIQCPAIL